MAVYQALDRLADFEEEVSEGLFRRVGIGNVELGIALRAGEVEALVVKTVGQKLLGSGASRARFRGRSGRSGTANAADMLWRRTVNRMARRKARQSG